jgi:hypothetical protein
MDRFADQDDGYEWSTMENLTFECKVCFYASSLRLISRLLPKIHFSETQTAHGFFSDLIS